MGARHCSARVVRDAGCITRMPIIGTRLSEGVELRGIDAAEHGETGCNLGEVTMGRS